MRKSRRLQNYYRFTEEELDSYARTENSCVHKINTNLHFALLPYVLADFKNSLESRVVQQKVGVYDVQHNGIILGAKNIKLKHRSGLTRADDAHIHADVNADCYIFRPEKGVILSGIVKHIGKEHVGVVIYHVFNVSIRFKERINLTDLQLDQEIKFCVCGHNMKNVFPYIEGELLTHPLDESIGLSTTQIKLETRSIASDSGADEERVSSDLDDLLNMLKNEPSPNKNKTRENNKFNGEVSKKRQRKKTDESVASKSKKRKTELDNDLGEAISASETKIKSESAKELSIQLKSKKSKELIVGEVLISPSKIKTEA